MNPYLIAGPAQISFSGGRSSAMMLCEIVKAYQGTLPADIHVLFANTGKEMEQTLEFVRRVGEHLGVVIHWLEYRAAKHQVDAWTEVTFETASRQGEPFREIVLVRGYTPNPVARICTQNLKVKAMEGFMRSRGYKNNTYASVAGMRADEPERVARGRSRQDVDLRFPLYDAGVRAPDVVAYWKAMPFDLELPSIGNKTLHGNCDLCYLKGPRTLISLIREKPERADWWAQLEQESGKTFRVDRPNYAAMKIMATQPQLFETDPIESVPDDPTLPCECTD